MMAQSWAEGTKDTYNYGQYLNQFPPNKIKLIPEFERIQKKICRHKMSIMFNEICINEEMLPKYTYSHIYTHILEHTYTNTHTRARKHTHTHTHTHIYIYISFKYPDRWQKLLGSTRSGTTTWSYQNCMVTLVGVWWGQGIARVFTRCMMKYIYIYIYLYILVYWNIYDEHWIVCETFFV